MKPKSIHLIFCFLFIISCSDDNISSSEKLVDIDILNFADIAISKENQKIVNAVASDSVEFANDKSPPVVVGANSNVVSKPSPAGNVTPVNEKPKTTPVSALNDVASKPDVAPNNSTPETTNWKPPTSEGEEYKISAD